MADVVNRISIDNTVHNDYGLGYPVTYEFIMPNDVLSAHVLYKFAVDDSWVQLTERIASNFFNGINAVRFDYPNHIAYVSIAFHSNTNNIFLKFIYSSNSEAFEVTYSQISEYYDDRICAVVITADDWNSVVGADADFSMFCGKCRSRSIVCSVGIITFTGGAEPNWNAIQAEINAGYVEADSHSYSHIHLPYGDYDQEIGTSKQMIETNLTLQSTHRKGSTNYCWAWLEPYCESNATQMTKCGEYKYLCSRRCPSSPANLYPTWNAIYGIYNRHFPSDQISASWGAGDLTIFKNDFDFAYANGRIFHAFTHPVGTAEAFWDAGLGGQALDWIKEKTDVWYVGLGALFVYHFVDERGYVTYAKGNWGEGNGPSGEEEYSGDGLAFVSE